MFARISDRPPDSQGRQRWRWAINKDSWEDACAALCEMRVPCALPGYTVIRGTISPASHKGGKACELQLLFRLSNHNKRIDDIDEVERVLERWEYSSEASKPNNTGA